MDKRKERWTKTKVSMSNLKIVNVFDFKHTLIFEFCEH